MRKENTAAYAASMRWLCIVLAIAILVTSAWAADNPLTADSPNPDETLLGIVINMDYPQQARMNAIARVAEQATAETMDASVIWLVNIIKNPAAQPVVRGHALDQIIALKKLPEGILDWLLASVSDSTQSPDWRIACISRLGNIYVLVEAGRGEDIVMILEAASKGNDIPVAASSLLAMAGIGGLSNTAHTFAIEKLEKVFSSGSASPEMLMAAMQAAVLLGNTSVLPTVRGIAIDNTRELRIRMAALGTLGELGTIDDANVISQAGNSSPLLRKVAGKAIVRLYDRQGE